VDKNRQIVEIFVVRRTRDELDEKGERRRKRAFMLVKRDRDVMDWLVV